jgi:hypothetical protein
MASRLCYGATWSPESSFRPLLLLSVRWSICQAYMVLTEFLGNFSHILPTKAILVGPFLGVLGGECVFSSTLFTLTSALAQEYVQRYEIHYQPKDVYLNLCCRASYFSYMSSISYVVAFIGPSLASFTMNQSLWLPFFINIALLLCAIPTISKLPEAKRSSVTSLHEPEDEEEEVGPLLANQDTSSSRQINAFETPANSFKTITHMVRKLIRLTTGRSNFQILLVSFFLTALASSDTKLLVQYMSKRYDWTFAQASSLTR